MKKKLTLWISLALGIIGVLIIIKNISFADIINTFRAAPPWAIGGYAACQVVIMLVHTWRWKLIIRCQLEKQVSMWHLFWYKVIGYAISYVTPTAKIGGEPVRAGLLTRHGTPFKASLSTVIIDKTLELTTSGLFFIIGTLIFITSFAIPQSTQEIMIIIAVLFFGIIFYFYYQMLKGKDFFGKLFRSLRLHKGKKGSVWAEKLYDFEQLMITFYSKEKKYFLATVMISMLTWVIMFIEFKFALIIVGYPQVSLVHLFLIISFMGMAYLVPIPMALGSLEASQLSVFAITKFRQSAGIALAFVIRIKELIWVIIGFSALSLYGIKPATAVKESQPLSIEIDRLK